MVDHIWKCLSVPSKGSLPPPFIVTRRGGAHEWGAWKSSFSPESRGTVAEYCRKYTVGHGVRRDSRPGYRPWSCGDRSGVLPAPASGVTAFRGPCRSGSGVLQRWHSAGPAGQSLVCTSSSGARGGPGPPGRSTSMHIRRPGRHVEVPDPSRGVRGPGCGDGRPSSRGPW